MTAPRIPPLTPAGWEQVRTWFDHATALPPSERAAWIGSLAGPPHLLETLRQMVAADADGAGLLDAGVAPAAHLVLEPEAVLPPGTAVGAFDIIGELDRGGMGIVYAARDRHLDRAVALKFVRARVGSDKSGAERVLAEAKAASALDHPNVATIYQVGESADGRYFIAMPRYEGEALRARLARGPLPLEGALAIARAVASGLAAAHRAGLVHRDVTAGNIFLTADGSVKLLDFGIAALASAGDEAGVGGGTLPYMSPEQLRGGAVDARADVWSLGVVLYRMLTGELPFAGATSAEILASIDDARRAPVLAGRAGVPHWLVAVVKRALAKAPASRYANAGEMLEALEAPEPARRSRGNGLAIGAAGFVFASALVIAAVGRDGPSTGGAPPTVGPRTLAILPPDAADGDSLYRYLADGMAGELTSRLAKLRRLRVKGPRAASGIDPSASPQAVGEALGVDYLIESSVARADSMTVVSLRLVDAREGFQLWADEYSMSSGELLSLQDSLARDVAGAVAGELGADERMALRARVTSSPAAYDHYLRGNYLLGKRSPAAVGEAIEEFSTAATLDGRFAEALAQGAYARVLMVDWGWELPGRTRTEIVDEAGSLVERAAALDPGSAAVWLAQAYLQVAADPFRFEGAVRDFERSLAIDSLNPEAHHQYGQTLMALGRYSEAVAAYERALELDPVRPMTLVPLAAIAMQQSDTAAAVRWGDSAVGVARLVPAPYALAVRGHIALRTGDAERALDDARRALDLDDSYPAPALSVVAVALSKLGRRDEARTALEELLASIDVEHPTPTDVRFVSSALFQLGRTDDALALVERAEPRGAQYWFYLQSTDFDPYRSLQRFRIVEKAADPRS